MLAGHQSHTKTASLLAHLAGACGVWRGGNVCVLVGGLDKATNIIYTTRWDLKRLVPGS